MIDFDRLEFLTPIQDLEKNKKKYRDSVAWLILLRKILHNIEGIKCKEINTTRLVYSELSVLVKAAVSILADFLSISQLAIPSFPSTSHDSLFSFFFFFFHFALFASSLFSSIFLRLTTGSAGTGRLCCFRRCWQTGPPLYGVLCPDWIKRAEIPEHLFSLWMHGWGEEMWATDQTLCTVL